MATVLDFSILTNFSAVFIFLTIFLAGWGLFLKTDFFGLGDEGKKVYSLMAFALAFLVILSPTVIEIFAFAIPWLTLLLFIAFFMLFFVLMFNPDFETGWLINQGTTYGFLITFVVIIMLFAFANSFGQDLLEQQPGYTEGQQVADQVDAQGMPQDTFVPEDEVQESTLEGQQGVSNAAGGPAQRDIGSNIVLTIFHPKVLGMFFVLVLATITMLLIAAARSTGSGLRFSNVRSLTRGARG